MRRWRRSRDTRSGEFVSAGEAAAHPDTTVTETVIPPGAHYMAILNALDALPPTATNAERAAAAVEGIRRPVRAPMPPDGQTPGSFAP